MDSRIERARVLAGLGRLEGARAMLGEVLAGEPEDVVALADMANVVFRMREYEKAVEYSAGALRGDPENTFAWRVRALAELALARDVERGVEEVRGHRERAVGAAEQAVRIDPEDTDNLRILAATMRDKDPAGALENLELALEIDPDDVGVHLLRGLILRRNLRGPDSVELAEAAFREALALDPENAEALYELALIELERGKRAAGEEQLRRVALLDPDYGDAVRENLQWLAREDDRLATAARAAEGTRAAPAPPTQPVRRHLPEPFLPDPPKRGGGRIAAGIGAFLVIMLIRAAIGGSSDSSTTRYTPPPPVIPTWVLTPPVYRTPPPFPSELLREWPSYLQRPTVQTQPPVAPTAPRVSLPPGVNPFQ